MDDIPLADALDDLRNQLAEAQRRAPEQGIGFIVDQAEIELTIAATRDVKAGGKVRWLVLEFGGEAKAGGSDTHRVKLKLSPVSHRDGQTGRLQIHDTPGHEPE